MNHHNRPGPDGNLWRGIVNVLVFYVIGFAAVVLVAQLMGWDR